MIYITRGITGSGKTTWIEQMKKLAKPGSIFDHCSAGHYHMANGVYRYDPARAGEAHAACMRKYARRLLIEHQKFDAIFVDNNNTSPWELSPYVQLAIAFNFDYEIRYFPCDLQTSIKRNQHNVPDSVILHMLNNLNIPLPAHWNIRVHGE